MRQGRLPEGNVEEAVALLEECDEICALLGERWIRSWKSWNLAVLWWRLGEYRKAQACILDSMRAKADLGDQLGLPYTLDLLAWIWAAHRSVRAARRAAVLFGIAEPMWARIGQPVAGFETLLNWRAESMARARDALGEPAYQAAIARGARMSLRDAIAYAWRRNEKPVVLRRVASRPIRC